MTRLYIINGHCPWGNAECAFGKTLSSLVLENVQAQVVRAWECSTAVSTLERPLSSVPAIVPSQLVRSSKRPITVLPWAVEWFLAGVNPLVGLEVRTLGVHLHTASVITTIHSLCDFLSTPALSLHSTWERTVAWDRLQMGSLHSEEVRHEYLDQAKIELITCNDFNVEFCLNRGTRVVLPLAYIHVTITSTK